MIEEVAKKMNRDISPNDGMFQGNDFHHYFSVAQSALCCINLAILQSGRSSSQIRKVLDLPCGHGRVLRILRAAFPGAQVTACDILEDGVDFCAWKFGAIPVYSREDPKEIPLEGSFDLIWVGSLFTHLNSERWAEFLSFFRDHLNTNGILIFSVHGRQSIHIIKKEIQTYGLERSVLKKLVRDAEKTGFGFENYPDATSYGISISLPSWVCSLLTRFVSLRLLSYSESAWDNHHDVVSCIRLSD